MFHSICLRLFSFLIRTSVYILMASLLAYPDMWLWNALIVPRFSFTSACNLDQAFLVVFVWFMFVTNPYDVVWVPANNQEDQDDNQN